MFEEGGEDDAPLCGGNKSASRAHTLTSMTTAVPVINFKERELTSAERNNVQTKIKDLKMKGRLMPDSALTTYFGKPAWHTYGNGNVDPGQGGLIYGDYMKTHNINPHSGDNKPEK